MSARGVFRGIYASLLDDPDFQRLCPEARHTLLTLRLCSQNNAASIFRYYAQVLAAQTGYRLVVLERALRELEREGWVLREGVVVWVRNGLRYDPSIRLADPKHQKAVERAIASLPKLDIVLRFCDYYQIPRPFEGPSEPVERPSGDPSPPIPIPKPNPSISSPLKGAAPVTVSRNGYREEAEVILDHLNRTTGRRFRSVPATLRPIEGRLQSGATPQQCKAVVDHQVREWRGDPKMRKYLRPKTLFNDTNFESYLAEATARPPDDEDDE